MTDVPALSENRFNCRFCGVCLGRGCVGQMPGMGGVDSSRNFILNCGGWDKIPLEKDVSVTAENLGIAPVTGAVQNIGFNSEEDFYFPYFSKSSLASRFISSTFFSFIVERIVT